MTADPDARTGGTEQDGAAERSGTANRRVAIAGAGKVGRSIAAELLENGSEVLIIERDPNKIRRDALPAADWLLADACELSSLDGAGLDCCAVMVAATGDDKVNLVVSLLAKTEFGVPRVVARVNHPKNEWLFTESWGVDVAVSAPRMLTALVEEAVSVGDLVRLMKFRQGDASLVELTLTADAPVVGRRLGDVDLPPDSAVVVILRDGNAVVPSPDSTLEPGDEVLAVATTSEAEESLAALLGAVPADASRNQRVSGVL
ncbi:MULTISPECIES: TrkA family potassium uptake protein [unclassified Parafrankia]|uniref:potassium channel family protein n=1 Tax=Parafrankia TaxID=2994362 RepID=UPI000DA58FA0|nr:MULTISPECIES: TrkA family potassium uptake protein [unclassified Parafrankia]CAI7977851.1 Trk system potassium uptake protein TrkA [Frankia sp. Hr75.2]SQD98815.1 Trk system potassium uptake protein TrkA [Parafrankia sp. Ea1.12]